jgi:signal transduction histidine kinase
VSASRVPPVPSDADRLDRLVNRIAVVGSTVATAVFVAVHLATGDPAHLVTAAGPAVAGVFFLIQRLRDRQNAFVAVMVGAGVVIAAFLVIGEPDTALGSALALVYIGMIGASFVHRHLAAYLIGGSLVVGVTPWLWGPRLPEGMSIPATTVVMVLGFCAASATMAVLRGGTVDATNRLRSLFDSAPVGLAEQDWTEAIAHLRRSVPIGVDLRAHLRRNPALVAEVVQRVSTLRVNLLAQDLVAADSSEMRGQLRRTRVTAETIDGWIDQIVALDQGRDVTVPEVPMRRFDGSIIHVEIAVIVVNGDLGTVIAAFKDVSEARAAREGLENLVKAKDQFIASVSHELRTPLTAVMGLTDEVRSGRISDLQEIGELLDLVARQSREVAYIVEDLLVGARADIGTVTVHPTDFELASLVHDIVGGSPALITVAAPGHPVMAHGDPVRVRQIIRNLVSNAERYGGGERRASMYALGGMVCFEMRDLGQPLGSEDRGRIFEPYQRAHERPGVPESVGLGLSVSRQLARLMGGDLIYDHDGEAVFRFTLPAAVGAPDCDQIAGRPALPAAATEDVATGVR